ncbi:unnamed protein product [Urochloa humidicola]
MANFAVNPHPFVPSGFVLQPREIIREPSRVRCFLAFSVDKANEDLAIALTEPKIAPEDFWTFARALCHCLLDNNVRAPEIQQCPMGEAFVRFDSPMQRETFILGGPRQFDDYQISFIRHDEGPNMRDLELDRSVWLMLLCFPPNAKNLISLVDKSVSGFGQLIHVHRSSSVARVICRVLVNKDADVPDSVTVSMGTFPRVHTWTVPVFLLSTTDVVMGGDEEPIPVTGPTHPMPHQAPGWMGPVGPHAADVNMEDAASGAADMGGGMAGLADAEQQRELSAERIDKAADVAPHENSGSLSKNTKAVSTHSGASADFAASGGIKSTTPLGPALPLNQAITSLVLSLPPLPISTCPFTTLSLFVIDLSIQVPSFFADINDLWYLAKVVMGPEEVAAGSKRPREAADQGTEDDVECRIVSKEEATPKHKTPRKRRARKPREPLGTDFVRRSTRTNKALAGFRNKSSVPAEKDVATPVDDKEQEATAEIVLESS